MKVPIGAAVLLMACVAGAQTGRSERVSIRLRGVDFLGATQLAPGDIEECRQRLQSEEYRPEKWVDEVAEAARILCWQSRGYFRADVKAAPTGERSVTLSVNEGDRYRLGKINFSGNKQITNTEALRKLIPLKDGDIFNSEAIRKGIENLRKAYGASGFINMTSVPDTKIDLDHKLINLDWDIDEGKQFYVRSIAVSCLSQSIEDALRTNSVLQSGQVYNQNLLDYSLGIFKEFVPPRTAVDVQVSTVKDSTPPAVDLRFVCTTGRR